MKIILAGILLITCIIVSECNDDMANRRYEYGKYYDCEARCSYCGMDAICFEECVRDCYTVLETLRDLGEKRICDAPTQADSQSCGFDFANHVPITCNGAEKCCFDPSASTPEASLYCQ